MAVKTSDSSGHQGDNKYPWTLSLFSFLFSLFVFCGSLQMIRSFALLLNRNVAFLSPSHPSCPDLIAV
jgi:hypothetical protein